MQEAGGDLSQGQRQLLCLCRVLLDVLPDPRRCLGIDGATEPRLILCDEPTSNCDLASDATIHRVLLEELPLDWTVAIICHRLHRVRSFDHVIVIEAGQVVEAGLPAELLGGRAEPVGGGLGTRCWLRELCTAQGVP